MSFYKDDPSYLHEVIWYRVPDSAPDLGLCTPFRTRKYMIANGEDLPVLGETAKGRSYRKGAAPYYLTGHTICGTPDQWLNGCLTTDFRPLVYGPGVPICCGPILLLGDGGAAAGGEAAHTQPTQPVLTAGGAAGSALGQTNWRPGAQLGGGAAAGGGVQTAFLTSAAGGGQGGGLAAATFAPCGNNSWGVPGGLHCTLLCQVQGAGGACAGLPARSIWYYDPVARIYTPPLGTAWATTGTYLRWHSEPPFVGPQLVVSDTGSVFDGFGMSLVPFYQFQLRAFGAPICSGSPADGYLLLFQDYS